MVPAFSILFVSCRCNLLSLWWYSWGLFVQLPPASCVVCFLWVPFLWLFGTFSFMSPAFLRCQWPWLSVCKHQSLQSWLNTLCRGAYVWDWARSGHYVGGLPASLSVGPLSGAIWFLQGRSRQPPAWDRGDSWEGRTSSARGLTRSSPGGALTCST